MAEDLSVNLKKAFEEVNKRLNELEKAKPGAKRNLVYVPKSELLAQNGVTAFSNGVAYSYTYPKPFVNAPYLNVQLELSVNSLQYISMPTNTGFKFACNYGAGIQGLWYEAVEIPQN
jgi:hypothetical protein|nr:MAG TPA: hypothetical protein [Caudoviricetes sp.]